MYGKNHRVERVYFKIDEARRNQWSLPNFKESKVHFFNEVERENHKQKINQFVDFCEDMIYELRYSASLFRHSQRLQRDQLEKEQKQIAGLPIGRIAIASPDFSPSAIFARSSNTARNVAYLMAFLINIILLMYREVEEDIDIDFNWAVCLQVLGYTHTLASIILLFSFFSLKVSAEGEEETRNENQRNTGRERERELLLRVAGDEKRGRSF